ncbi:MAG: oligoendopeptidase [Holophagaceae bacterium]|nr:oligoendopeptidase [Holophagaceae bacterium]
MKSMTVLTCLLSLSSFFAPDAMAGEPKKVDPAYVWDLSLLYRDEAAYRAAKEHLAQGLVKIPALQGHLGDSPRALADALDTIYGLRKELVRLNTYAHLAHDENTKLTPGLERSQELDMLATRFSQTLSFLRPEILALGEARIKGFLAQEPRLAIYRFPLEEILRSAPHTLGAEAEGVLSAVGLLADTPSSLYGILANADMPWPKVKLSDGKEVLLDQSGYSRYRASQVREDREKVFQAFFGKLKEYERSFGVALFSQIKTDCFGAQVRKYPDSLASALADNDIPEAVYRTLIAETHANLPTLHRYFRLRAKMLGLKELRYSDIYPPIVKTERSFPYPEAQALIIEATKPLGATYTQDITQALHARYTDVFPQPGKRSGAYMSGNVHDGNPFVLMNYNSDYESVSTLAHEWGHGIHSVLANRHQPFATADYSIFTAEIASTLNEALLLDHMLKVAKSDEEKLYYLGSALEGLRGTFFRQAMFAEFELAIHEEVEKGGALSGDKLTRIYGDILKRYHGHDQGIVKIDDTVTVEWAYIPHFYYNFYVYQYATSIAASQAFALKIKQGEPKAVDTYLGLLKAGGSDHPYALVKRAGVDLASPAPYRALAARMEGIMDQIEAILAKQK